MKYSIKCSNLAIAIKQIVVYWLLTVYFASALVLSAPSNQTSARPVAVLNGGVHDKAVVGISPDNKALVNAGALLLESLKGKIISSPSFRLSETSKPGVRIIISTNSFHTHRENQNEDVISYSVLWLFTDPNAKSASPPLDSIFVGMETDSFILNSSTVGNQAKLITDGVAEKILSATDKHIPMSK